MTPTTNQLGSEQTRNLLFLHFSIGTKNNEKRTTLNSLRHHNTNNHKSRTNLDQEASPPLTKSKKDKRR